MELIEQPSPVSDSAYKHREDLIDALLCAWTASLWARHGFDRCQVLGLPANPTGDQVATMIVPTRPEQCLQPLSEIRHSYATQPRKGAWIARPPGRPLLVSAFLLGGYASIKAMVQPQRAGG
jgi:hypothetical protein